MEVKNDRYSALGLAAFREVFAKAINSPAGRKSLEAQGLAPHFKTLQSPQLTENNLQIHTKKLKAAGLNLPEIFFSAARRKVQKDKKIPAELDNYGALIAELEKIGEQATVINLAEAIGTNTATLWNWRSKKRIMSFSFMVIAIRVVIDYRQTGHLSFTTKQKPDGPKVDSTQTQTETAPKARTAAGFQQISQVITDPDAFVRTILNTIENQAIMLEAASPALINDGGRLQLLRNIFRLLKAADINPKWLSQMREHRVFGPNDLAALALLQNIKI